MFFGVLKIVIKSNFGCSCGNITASTNQNEGQSSGRCFPHPSSTKVRIYYILFIWMNYFIYFPQNYTADWCLLLLKCCYNSSTSGVFCFFWFFLDLTLAFTPHWCFCMFLFIYSHPHCTVLQWGRLLHCVVAVWAGCSALLPEMWPPASPLAAEGRCSALPAGPAAGCPAHQWRGEASLRAGVKKSALHKDIFSSGQNYNGVLCCRFWLKFAPGISLLSLSATRRPVKAWQWVSNAHKCTQTRTHTFL